MSHRDEYIAKMKLQLDKLNASLSEFEASADAAKKGTHAAYKEEISKLRIQSQLAVDKLDELVAAGENSWEGLVAETEKVRDAFVRSFHYFKSQV